MPHPVVCCLQSYLVSISPRETLQNLLTGVLEVIPARGNTAHKTECLGSQFQLEEISKTQIIRVDGVRSSVGRIGRTHCPRTTRKALPAGLFFRLESCCKSASCSNGHAVGR